MEISQANIKQEVVLLSLEAALDKTSFQGLPCAVLMQGGQVRVGVGITINEESPYLTIGLSHDYLSHPVRGTTLCIVEIQSMIFFPEAIDQVVGLARKVGDQLRLERLASGLFRMIHALDGNVELLDGVFKCSVWDAPVEADEDP